MALGCNPKDRWFSNAPLCASMMDRSPLAVPPVTGLVYALPQGTPANSRLVSVTTGVRVDPTGNEPCPLWTLAAAELEGLHSLLLAGAEASDDASVVHWCTRMNGLILADFCRRESAQLVIDAKVEAIVAEERRLACLVQHVAPKSAV